MKKIKELTYKEAMAALEDLTKKIENPETPLEDITGEVKLALELIEHCRELIGKYKSETDKLLE